MPFRPIGLPGHNPAKILQPPVVVRARLRPDLAAARSAAAAPARPHHIVDRSGPNWDEDGDYIVGKGRSPVTTRWQKGQSGNPRGPKAKEKKDQLSTFHEEVLADFTARLNGEDTKMNLGSFVLQLIKANAAKGSAKAQQMLLELFLNAVNHRANANASPEIEPWEQELIDTVLAAHNLPASPVVRKSRDLNSPSVADA